MKATIGSICVEGSIDELASLVLKISELQDVGAKTESIDSFEPESFFEPSKRKLIRHRHHKGKRKKGRLAVYSDANYERIARWASEHKCSLGTAWRRHYGCELKGGYYYECERVAKRLRLPVFKGIKKV